MADAIDADVAEALKQLKRGFRETEPKGPMPSPGMFVPMQRPPWDPSKMARTGPPKAPMPQAAKNPMPQPNGAIRPGIVPSLINPRPGAPGAAPYGGVANNSSVSIGPSIGPPLGPSMGPSIGISPPLMTGALPAAQLGGQTKKSIEIPQSHVGLIIGKQATTINSIKSYSKANCFVEQRTPSEEQARVTIIGSPTDVEKAKMAVQGLIDGSWNTQMLASLAIMPAGAGNAGSLSDPMAGVTSGGSAGTSTAAADGSAGTDSNSAHAGQALGAQPSAMSASAAAVGALSAASLPLPGAGALSGSGANPLSSANALTGAALGGAGVLSGVSALLGAAGLPGGNVLTGAPALPGTGTLPGSGALAGGLLGATGAGLPQMPTVTGALGGGNPLAAIQTISTTGGGVPQAQGQVQDHMNEYYARFWSQYGNMVSTPADSQESTVKQGSEAAQTGPAAFDKAALARLAEKASMDQELETQREAIKDQGPPAFDKDALARLAEKAATPDQESSDPGPPPKMPPSRVPGAGFLSGLSSAAGRQSDSITPGGGMQQTIGTDDRGDAVDLGQDPASVMPQPLVPPPSSGQATPRPTFTSFSLSAGAPQPQKDNDSVQNMLQRLQSNMQQTKQAMSVQHSVPQGFGAPVAQKTDGMPQANAVQILAHPVSAPDYDNTLEQRVVNARSPQEVEEVGKMILAKFPTLPPEQIAELLHKMERLLNMYHGEFLSELSRLLAARFKEFSSTQCAMLMSSFLLWKEGTRERFSEYSRDLTNAAFAELPSRLMEMAPHELNCCLAGFLSLGHADQKFFTAVGRSVLAKHKTFGPVQLCALLTILAEMRLVHAELFLSAAQVIGSRVRELRPADIIRLLRALGKCNVSCDPLCQAVASDIVTRFKDRGANTGFRVEDLCEIAWTMCVQQSYQEDFLRLVFKQLEETPKVGTDALCMMYEVHLFLISEYKEPYARFHPPLEKTTALLDLYKQNRKDARRCSERLRSDVASVLKSLVEGTVHTNHRTSIGLLTDVAALRKQSSTDGYIHIDIDSQLSTIRQIDQEDTALAQTALAADGSVALRRRMLQKHNLRLISVREQDWFKLDDSKEKRRHLRSLLSSLGDVFE